MIFCLQIYHFSTQSKFMLCNQNYIYIVLFETCLINSSSEAHRQVLYQMQDQLTLFKVLWKVMKPSVLSVAKWVWNIHRAPRKKLNISGQFAREE